MLRKKYKKGLIFCAYLLSTGTLALCIGMIINGVNNYLLKSTDYDYGVYNVFEDVLPVTEEISTEIIKPFISESVSISKYFYDYEADMKEQENSLVYYENTYMQNSGIDYVSEIPFDIVSILDGKVSLLREDELLGKTLQITHSNELISVYQGIDNILVKEGDSVNQGSIIATSSTNIINNNYPNQLHFEIYYKGELLDPENIYSLNIEDFN